MAQLSPPARLNTPAPRHAWPRILRDTLLVVTLTAGLTLALLEVGLRLFAPQISPEMRADQLDGLFVSDPTTGNRNAPGAHIPFRYDEFDTSFDINAQGLREDRLVGPPLPGTTRLLCLGDSFTFGWGVPVTQTYPYLLRDSRAADNSPIDSVNGGVNGYGPDNEAAWLRVYGWPLQPKIVLVGFFVGNDVRDTMLGLNKTTVDEHLGLVSAGSSAPRTPLAALKSWLAHHSQAYVLLRRLAHDWFAPSQPAVQQPGLYDTAPFYYKAVPPDIASGWDKATGFLDAMRADAQAHGAMLVVVAIPAREQVEDSYWQEMKNRFGLREDALARDLPQQKLAAWAARTGAPLIDLLPDFRAAPAATPLYFRDDPHWNTAGHALAARLLRADLIRLGLFSH